MVGDEATCSHQTAKIALLLDYKHFGMLQLSHTYTLKIPSGGAVLIQSVVRNSIRADSPDAVYGSVAR
jgi:hypothetical protein